MAVKPVSTLISLLNKREEFMAGKTAVIKHVASGCSQTVGLTEVNPSKRPSRVVFVAVDITNNKQIYGWYDFQLNIGGIQPNRAPFSIKLEDKPYSPAH